jgi:hypothetical protein
LLILVGGRYHGDPCPFSSFDAVKIKTPTCVAGSHQGGTLSKALCGRLRSKALGKVVQGWSGVVLLDPAGSLPNTHTQVKEGTLTTRSASSGSRQLQHQPHMCSSAADGRAGTCAARAQQHAATAQMTTHCNSVTHSCQPSSAASHQHTHAYTGQLRGARQQHADSRDSSSNRCCCTHTS